ncbi:MAG: LysM peptidoglycan-binding domain-containing protein [Bacteriovoracaceae bacterium]
MKTSIFATLLILTLLTGCTGRSAKVEENPTTAAVENTDSDNVDEIIAEEASAPADAANPAEVVNSQEQVDDIINAASTAGPPVIDNSQMDKPSNQIEKKIYQVKKDETLMLISFKIYGDYSRWKELRDLNKKKLINGLLVKNGAEIEYMSDGTEFQWQPRGNPHLIKSGDTLGIISKEYYGTLKKWKDIWENNKPMIKDPNKIYAGFTIYYVPGEKSTVALQ